MAKRTLLIRYASIEVLAQAHFPSGAQTSPGQCEVLLQPYNPQDKASRKPGQLPAACPNNSWAETAKTPQTHKHHPTQNPRRCHPTTLYSAYRGRRKATSVKPKDSSSLPKSKLSPVQYLTEISFLPSAQTHPSRNTLPFTKIHCIVWHVLTSEDSNTCP